MGEDLITKYYNDKPTEEAPEIDVTERLIFYGDNKYLVVNFYQLETGTYEIQYPAIRCQTYNESLEGITNAVIKTEAECSKKYFDKYSIKLDEAVTNRDTCLYTSLVQFNFWKGGEFNFEVIFVIMGVLFLVAGIITTWAIFIYNKELFLRRTLDMYSNPNVVEMKSGTGMPGYNVMVEEKQEEGRDVNISDTGKELEADHGTHSID